MSLSSSQAGSAEACTATYAQNQAKSSPGQRVIIYKLSPDQLHAEIAAVGSYGNVTYAVVLQKQADADPIGDTETEKKKKETKANLEAAQLHNAPGLQTGRS
ncbi:uncharacterized protein ALTATR162_LOCUS6188 [Alternaria atra]|uniref:Uncharacterized protein n=1 Tax=Alternaria atra TaxID=119953 RepID=A0A8J2I2H6_9PLEO|nr:uncharacterized protein ALTATR162_LOCUS6188 [Alternaria atra]CAG5162259.1 unnamed protein product [Alternaria atra]